MARKKVSQSAASVTKSKNDIIEAINEIIALANAAQRAYGNGDYNAVARNMEELLNYARWVDKEIG